MLYVGNTPTHRRRVNPIFEGPGKTCDGYVDINNNDKVAARTRFIGGFPPATFVELRDGKPPGASGSGLLASPRATGAAAPVVSVADAMLVDTAGKRITPMIRLYLPSLLR
ncbi:MAG: hypothetical protein ABIQ99_18565 [Thermoflexales bacterium]